MTALKMRDAGGVLRTITGLAMRDAAGVLRQIKTLKMRDAAGVLRTVFSSASGLFLSPGYASGYGSSAGTIYVTSNAVNIIGAPAGATIVWHSDNVAVTIVTPSAPSTVFRAHLASGITQTANVYATVNGVNTETIAVELTNGGIA